MITLLAAINPFRSRPRLPEPTTLLQEAPLAGFQYHNGRKVWRYLQEGETLRLKREPFNFHDRNAVAVYFRNEKLGYLPQSQNLVAAQMLDRGENLIGKIKQLVASSNPQERISMQVWLAAGA
ncbi:MAG TPA: HIRAN protein [Porticoccaceae bacterium]|nr:HIRAN protein [Porticoccaceae bacterium]